MSANLLFLNNRAMERLGVGDMALALHDVERAYSLYASGDVSLFKSFCK